MGVLGGRDYDHLVLEEGQLLRAHRPAVHQGFDALLPGSAARHLVVEIHFVSRVTIMAHIHIDWEHSQISARFMLGL